MKRRELLTASLGLPWLGLTAASAWAQDNPPPAFDPSLAQTDPAQAAQAWIEASQPEGLAALNKVCIAQFRVMFATRATASASASGGFGSGPGSANMHGSYTLAGVDDALMQSITDTAYQRLTASLQARGLTVVPFDALPAAAVERFKKDAVAAPAEIKRGSGRGQGKTHKLFSAQGLPLYFSTADPLRSLMGFGVSMSGLGWDALDYVESGVSGPEQLGLLKVTLVMDFIETDASGGFFARTASVDGKPGIKLTTESNLRAMVPQLLSQKPKPDGSLLWTTASYTFDKMPTLALKQTLQPANSGLLGVNDVTDATVAGVQTALAIVGFLGGMGGGRKDKSYEVKVDPAQDQASAQATMGAVLDTWARQIGPGN